VRGVLRVALAVLFTLSLSGADFAVTNTNADGEGSLAEAVRLANGKPGSRVLFGLEGTPPFEIEIGEPLRVHARTHIKGESQPGYVGTPLITIVNRTASPAIEVTASSSSITSLGFLLAEGGAIHTSGRDMRIYSNTIARLGAPHANEQAAIRVTGSDSLIAGNRVAFGTCIAVENGRNNWIYVNELEGCYATALALTSAPDNSMFENIITAPAVSGSAAITVDAASNANYIARHRIDGFAGGIDVRGNSSYIDSNEITDASAFGIRVDGGDRNRLTENMLAATSAIVLENGGNHGLRAPRLHHVVVDGDKTIVTGNLNGPSFYQIELYVSDECGTQRRFVGNGATEDLNFTFTIPAITPGSRVSAIAIDHSAEHDTFADTSPFSNCVTASGTPSVPPPVITSVTKEGWIGDFVTLNGTGIHPNARIFFGSVEGRFDRYSVTPRARVPEGSGRVDVTVRNPDGREAVVRGAFTYKAPCWVYVNRNLTNVSIEHGQSATLTVVASTKAGPLTYQWYRGRYPDPSAPIAGETSASITVTPSATTQYYVRIENACGKHSFSSATVSLPRRRAAAH
jgi:Right handed beta helix region